MITRYDEEQKYLTQNEQIPESQKNVTRTQAKSKNVLIKAYHSAIPLVLLRNYEGITMEPSRDGPCIARPNMVDFGRTEEKSHPYALSKFDHSSYVKHPSALHYTSPKMPASAKTSACLLKVQLGRKKLLAVFKKNMSRIRFP